MSLLVLLLLVAGPARADVLLLTGDRAVMAPDVRMTDAGNLIPVNPDGTRGEAVPVADLMLLRFDTRPCHTRPQAWLFLRDGRRLAGEALKVTGDSVTLEAPPRPAVTVSREKVSALFFKAAQPQLSPPPTGVRIISANGDVLDAPAIELTDTGVVVDVGPDADPIFLARERVAGVIWPVDDSAGASAREAASQLVELRDGQRLSGRVTAVDASTVTLETAEATRSIDRRQVEAIRFRSCTMQWADELMASPVVSDERPSYRRNRNGLAAPLRIGQRVYPRGIGVRGPATVSIPVPAGARWFLACVGADTDAARFARLSWAIRTDTGQELGGDNIAPGQPARDVAIAVAKAKQIALTVQPANDDPTGCLGDFADAIFICD